MGSKVFSNTIITYGRTILSVLLSLYSTRWALNELGASDYGLYSLVGSILTVLVFLNLKMISGTSRFYAYEIGRKCNLSVQKYFNTAVSVNVMFSVLFIMLVLSLGPYLIYNVLDIPADRLNVSVYVLFISSVVTVTSLMTTPYSAMFTAKQNLKGLSMTLLLQSVLIFVGTYCLRYFSGDKLIVYTVIMALVHLTIYLLQIFYARYLYAECRIKKEFLFEKSRIKELTKYSFWNLLADAGHLVRTQGLNFLTNIFYSTKGNTSLSIANSIASQSCTLTNSLSQALAPAIITREAENDKNVLNTVLFYSKIAITLTLIFSVPIIAEIENLLQIWLGTIPDKSPELCVCVIIMYVIEKMTFGLEFLLQAKGQIAKTQSFTAFSYSLSILFAFIFIKVGFGIVGVGLACILSMVMAKVGVVYYAKRFYSFNLLKYYLKFLLSVLLLVILSMSASLLMVESFAPTLWRLILNGIFSAVITVLFSVVIVFDSDSRKYLLSFVKSEISKRCKW